MPTPLISLIVPVYNTEQYLDECIASILAQQFTDFELLLIDDGSTDGSLPLCQQAACRDSRVRILTQPHAGVSAARNRGIDAARGEWIGFIDSDDRVEPGYLSAFVERGTLRRDCLNQQGWKVLCDGTCTPGWQYPDICLDADGLRRHIGTYRVINNNAPYSKLFHKGLLDEHRLRFDTQLAIREDAFFVYQYRSLVATVHLLAATSYHYRRERQRLSLSHQIHPHAQFLYLKEVLPPAIARFMDTFALWDNAYARTSYRDNKSTIVFSGVKALYAHRVGHAERLSALRDLLDSPAYYSDPHFQPTGPTKHLHRLCRTLPLSLLDAALYAPLKPYYRMVYFQRF